MPPPRQHVWTLEFSLPFLDLVLIVLPREVKQGMGIHKQEIGHGHVPGDHVCHVVVGDTMVSKRYGRDRKENSDCRQKDYDFISHVGLHLEEHSTWV